MLDEINEHWLLQKIRQGEDSQTQFKAEIVSDSLAAEMVAFSNAYGGHLLIGVDNHGQIKGLSFEQIELLNQTISTTAHQKVQPPILPLTKILTVEEKSILVVFISKGVSKPYCTNKGVYWMKNGADKARSSREELLRSFQESGAFSADELPVAQTDCYSDLDRAYFYTFLNENTAKTTNKRDCHLKNSSKTWGWPKIEPSPWEDCFCLLKNPNNSVPHFTSKPSAFTATTSPIPAIYQASILKANSKFSFEGR